MDNEIKTQLLRTHFDCACNMTLQNAIKHTKEYCYTENQAIKVELSSPPQSEKGEGR